MRTTVVQVIHLFKLLINLLNLLMSKVLGNVRNVNLIFASVHNPDKGF